jgi:hypothetical protein
MHSLLWWYLFIYKTFSKFGTLAILHVNDSRNIVGDIPN